MRHHQHLFRPPGFLSLLLSLWAFVAMVRAEGTAQLMPQGNSSACKSYVQGNDGSGKEGPTFGRPFYDHLHIHIHQHETERIYYGFSRMQTQNGNPLYFRLLDPQGGIVAQGEVGDQVGDPGFIPDDELAAYVGPVQIAGEASGGYLALVMQPLMNGDYRLQFNVGDPETPNPSGGRYFVHPLDITVADASLPDQPVAIPGRLFSYKWHLNTNSGSNKACMEFFTWTPDSLVAAIDMNEIQPWGYTISFNSHGATRTGDLQADRKSTTAVSEAVPEYPVFLNEPDPAAYPTGIPGTVQIERVNGCLQDHDYCIHATVSKRNVLNVYLDLDQSGAYEAGGVDLYFPHLPESAGAICIPWDGRDGQGNLIQTVTDARVMIENLSGTIHVPVYDAENHKHGFNARVLRPVGLHPLMFYDNSSTNIGTVNLEGCQAGCNAWTDKRGDRVMANTWMHTISDRDSFAFSMANRCPPLPQPDTACTRKSIPIEIAILANDTDGDNRIDSNSVTLEVDPNLATVGFSAGEGLMRFAPLCDDYDTVYVRYQVCDNTPEAEGGPLCRTSQVVVDVYEGCQEVVFLGTGDEASRDEALEQPCLFEAYPNPSQTQIVVHLRSKYLSMLRIYDPAGRTHWEMALDPQLEQQVLYVPTHTWARGVYYLSVWGKRPLPIQKIVLE